MKPKSNAPAPSSRWQNYFLGGVAVIGAAVVLCVVVFLIQTPNGSAFQQPAATNPLDAERAMGYLRQVAAIGPRYSGSEGMKKQQELLKAHFEKLGGKVSLQEFTATHPKTGAQVPMANLLVQWHPEKQERVVLCAHYDTRPLPDRDADPASAAGGQFIGANDGASGVAVLMELAHLMPKLESRYGVDFVMFDGEELVYWPGGASDDVGEYFLGAIHFAQEYARSRPRYRYRWGVLMDMVGDKDLRIPFEMNSVTWTDTQPLVDAIWSTARRLGVREFAAQQGPWVRDDHLAMHDLGGIPTCDLIDFDYGPNNGYWHTTLDKPENCSGESVARVGWVLYEWLSQSK